MGKYHVCKGCVLIGCILIFRELVHIEKFLSYGFHLYISTAMLSILDFSVYKL